MCVLHSTNNYGSGLGGPSLSLALRSHAQPAGAPFTRNASEQRPPVQSLPQNAQVDRIMLISYSPVQLHSNFGFTKLGWMAVYV